MVAPPEPMDVLVGSGKKKREWANAVETYFGGSVRVSVSPLVGNCRDVARGPGAWQARTRSRGISLASTRSKCCVQRA